MQSSASSSEKLALEVPVVLRPTNGAEARATNCFALNLFFVEAPVLISAERFDIAETTWNNKEVMKMTKSINELSLNSNTRIQTAIEES